MRNLKRALSLALASIMLLGMMVVGTSAASTSGFPDAGKISNAEAVDLTSGLGIFKGYEDGNFKPENIVTRAEMAVMICKILHGADVDPANFAGAGKFDDVPAWAEGYVNLCASLKIIEGYGNKKFGPNDPVTTVQASTMLLKALGYYTEKENALGADWQLEVTSKATALGLYGDLTLEMNKGLTRDNAAEMLYNTLFAQRVAYDNNRVLYVKANDRNVVVTNGTNDPMNTLAQNTFGLYVAEGTVVANGMTDKALSESTKSKAMTSVRFDDKFDLNKDGKFEIAAGETYDFEAATGLDMIGHAAKIYYKIEKNAPVVFAITDQATLVKYVTYDANTTLLADAANEAGFKKNSILDVAVKNYIVNYDFDVKYTDGAFPLDTLLVISNSGNKNVDVVIALDQNLNKIGHVDEYRGETTYSVEYGTDGKDMNVVTKEFKENDYVITTDIGRQGKVLVLEPATVLSADITKITGKSTSNSEVKMVTASGVDYTKSEVHNLVSDNFENFSEIATIGSANLVLDQFGNLIGLAGEKTVPNYAYVAQFGIRHSTSGLQTKDVWAAEVYFADGTSGVYEIDEKKSSIFDESVMSSAAAGRTHALGHGDFDTADEANGDVKANSGLKGIYDAKILSNGKVEIDALTTNVTEAAKQNGVRLATAHSTLLLSGANYNYKGNVATKSTGSTADDVIYQNNDTVYFYVTGSYADDNLKVSVLTGVKNAVKFTNDTSANDTTIKGTAGNGKGTGIRETFANVKADAKDFITTMLVQGVEVENETLYYYDQGNYSVVREGDKGYTLTYNLYDAKTGEAKTVTYDNDGKFFETVQLAKDHAASLNDGFYKIGSRNLIVNYAPAAGGVDGIVGTSNPAKVVNDVAEYDEVVDNLFTSKVPVASIIGENTKIVDICDSGLTTVRKIANALKYNPNDGTHSIITLSYLVDSKLNTPVVFVTEYKPDATKPIEPDQPTGVINEDMLGAELDGRTLKVVYGGSRDSREIAEAYLNKLGYSVVDYGYPVGSDFYVKASKGGTNYNFKLEETEANTVTVDGKVVGYTAASFTKGKAVEMNVTGNGTGYLKDGTYNAYSVKLNVAATNATDVVVESGYVTVDNNVNTISGVTANSNGGTVTIEKTKADKTFAKANEQITYTVTYKVETADADKDLLVTFPALTGTNETGKTYTIAQAAATQGTDKTFTITLTAKGDANIGKLGVTSLAEVQP